MKMNDPIRGAGRLFGLPFFIVGLLVLFFGTRLIYTTFQVQLWDKVPVTIQKLAIKSHKGEKGSTYSIETQYEYTYQNRKYHGTGFSFSPGSDTMTNHQDLIDQVKSRDPAFVWVNPKQPSQAVLVNEMPAIGVLLFPFGLAFLLVGLFQLVGWAGRKHPLQFNNPKHGILLLPMLCSVLMTFINAFLLIKWVGPTTSFYLTVAIIVLVFLAGWFWYRRSTSQSPMADSPTHIPPQVPHISHSEPPAFNTTLPLGIQSRIIKSGTNERGPLKNFGVLIMLLAIILIGIGISIYNQTLILKGSAGNFTTLYTLGFMVLLIGMAMTTATYFLFIKAIQVSFLMLVINYILNGVLFFVELPTGLILYITPIIIGFVLFQEWFRYFFRQPLDADILMQTPLGSDTPFTIILYIKENPTLSRKKNKPANPPTPIEISKVALEVYDILLFDLGRKKYDRDALPFAVLTADFNCHVTANVEHRYGIKTVNIDEKVSNPWLTLTQKYGRSTMDEFKKTPPYQDVAQISEMAKWMSLVLQGGAAAPTAAQRLREYLHSPHQTDHKISSWLTVTLKNREKVRFNLPDDLWTKEIQPGQQIVVTEATAKKDTGFAWLEKYR